jgi:putative transposase
VLGKLPTNVQDLWFLSAVGAVMESWFATVKSEEGERFESYAHAKEALFDYIEVFYNQRRRHSTLGQISPAEFERRSTHAA